MKVLIVKTSSLGDIIHTLPALTDASKAIPNIRFDWVAEEAFTEIPTWHPRVDRVIPVAIRRWRKNIRQALRSGEWHDFYHALRDTSYDIIIDAQGLVKSALITRLAQGFRCGLDHQSAWEFLAAFAYQKRVAVSPMQHAVTRVRHLFAKILNYPIPDSAPDYGIDSSRWVLNNAANGYLVFLHGTTWPTKHWPEPYWEGLLKIATEAGYAVKLPWGNNTEYERAERLSLVDPKIEVLPKLNLKGVAEVLAGAKAVVAVDTGLGHLAAAINVPTLSLYGPTHSELTGTAGTNQAHLSAIFPCSPCLKESCTYKEAATVWPACFEQLTPKVVWQQLTNLLKNSGQIQ